MIRVFKHYIPKSLIFLAIAEFLLFLGSIYVGTYIRYGSVDTAPPGGGDFPEGLGYISVVYTFIMMSALTAVGLYQRHLRAGIGGMFLRLIMAFLIGLVAMVVLGYFFPLLFLGRGAFGISYGVSLLGILLARYIFIRIVSLNAIKKRILVIGAGEKASLIEQYFKRKSDRREFNLVGYVHLPHEDVQVDPEKVIETDLTFMELCKKMDIDELVVAVTDRRKYFPVDDILDCKMSGIEVVDLLTFFERQSGRIVLDILQPSWLIYSDGFSQGNMRAISKRLFDITASLLLLVLVSPIMLLTAILVFLQDFGPIFYKQIRVGQNWRLVQVLKFRSMRVDAEKDGKPQWATKGDTRVTPLGRFIRKTRIDELPQLINVLRGDMSFVGPRPERPQFVSEFSENIPYYAERHRVKPGITGWAQICYPYGASEKDTIAKLQYDLYYVKNYSLFLDLTILFQTAEVILLGKGAR
ncbi:MAG: TIGR03013 family PEP-CTERM/XrtA system glycosyltransferase [Gammaproteobacteria bacterium]|nr:TIGR03013 family PEP-CTERM/XrtA system glycosyltransferase [Gammaproteobacteria bacterium]MDH5691950.1 TIGR03013 family PEP-CTERM/XrtA system glycosyltransferase [Gammaproteobacteria bacterium]